MRRWAHPEPCARARGEERGGQGERCRALCGADTAAAHSLERAARSANPHLGSRDADGDVGHLRLQAAVARHACRGRGGRASARQRRPGCAAVAVAAQPLASEHDVVCSGARRVRACARGSRAHRRTSRTTAACAWRRRRPGTCGGSGRPAQARGATARLPPSLTAQLCPVLGTATHATQAVHLAHPQKDLGAQRRAAGQPRAARLLRRHHERVPARVRPNGAEPADVEGGGGRRRAALELWPEAQRKRGRPVCGRQATAMRP